jgi:hypothetical protein
MDLQHQSQPQFILLVSSLTQAPDIERLDSLLCVLHRIAAMTIPDLQPINAVVGTVPPSFNITCQGGYPPYDTCKFV